MIYLFHLYQPSWQEKSVLRAEYNRTYFPLVKILEQNPNIHMTVNITGSLTQQLLDDEKTEFFDLLKMLVDRNQVELTGSAMFHPLLPLIPENEILRQIQLNEELNQKALGDSWKKAQASPFGRGFYLPELAYSDTVARVIRQAGFQWITVDQSSMPENNVDWSKRYQEKNTELPLLIHNRIFHSTSEDRFMDTYNVLISDGENQIDEQNMEIDWNTYLYHTIHDHSIIYLTANEYFSQIPEDKISVALHQSSWQTSDEDLNANTPFPLWDMPSNAIHQLLWSFLRDVRAAVIQNPHDLQAYRAQCKLDRGLSSCTWWWADGRILGYNPTNICRGLESMISAVRALETLQKKERLVFEKRYSQIVFEVWARHWNSQ